MPVQYFGTTLSFVKTDPASGIGWVLTAAHCVAKPPVYAYLGEDYMARATVRFTVLDNVADATTSAAKLVDDAPVATTPYKRPSGATTVEQRAAVQGNPCVDCGQTAPRMNADHKKPLVKEHYETGTVDRNRMRQKDAVQSQCPTCSNRQGADLSRYSRQQRKRLEEEQRRREQER